MVKAMLIGKCVGLSNYINKNERLKINRLNTQFENLEIVHKVSSRDLKSENKKVENVETTQLIHTLKS